MAKSKRLIFEVDNLLKNYRNSEILKIKKLEIHPGTIYGILGTIGSGKSTLLNILAGVDKESSGTVLYDNKAYETNWLGKIRPHNDIFYTRYPHFNGLKSTVEGYIIENFSKKKNILENRYFKDGSYKYLLKRKIKELSEAELNWLGMILSLETDPRVLLVDDYGLHFNNSMEKDFRSKIISLNRTLGTTIVLSAPSEIYLKHFASVLIFLDHGHIWKIRPGISKNNNKTRKNKKGYNSKRLQNRNKNNKKYKKN